MDKSRPSEGTRLWVGRFVAFASILTAAGIAVALIELAGWAFGAGPLIEADGPGQRPMQPSTAFLVGLIGIGARLLLVGRPRRTRFARTTGASLVVTAILLAAIYLWSHSTAVALPHLLRPGPSDPALFAGGLPSANSAFLLAVVAGGILLLSSARQHLAIAGQWAAAAAIGISGSILVALAYGAPPSGTFPLDTSEIALSTAVAVLLIGTGAVFARADIGVVSAMTGSGPGAVLLRRLLPGLILLPPLVMGLIEAQRRLDRPRVVSLLAVMVAMGATVTLASAARRIDDHDRRRTVAMDRAVRARRALEQRAPVVSLVEKALRTHTATNPPGLEIAVRYRSQDGVLSGDAVDIHPLGGARVGIVLIDVAGHGAVPALTSLRLKDGVVQAMRAGASPRGALASIDWLLADSEEMATAVVCDLDGETGALRCVVAGHPPPLISTPSAVFGLEATGPLLHASVELGWDQHDVRLEEGSTLILYTDGLLDRLTADGTNTELDLLEVVRRLPADRPEAVADWLLEPGGHGTFRDDVAVIVVRRLAIHAAGLSPAVTASVASRGLLTGTPVQPQIR